MKRKQNEPISVAKPIVRDAWKQDLVSIENMPVEKGKIKQVLSPPHLYNDYKQCKELAPEFLRKYRGFLLVNNSPCCFCWRRAGTAVGKETTKRDVEIKRNGSNQKETANA